MNRTYKRGIKAGQIYFLALATVLLIIPIPFVSGGEKITLMELESVTDLIMSPGCNYIYTLTNCPSAEAEQMREIVKDRLRNGETGTDILSYFEKVYGPRVLAQPAKRGFYFVAWWFPYFLLLDVFVLVGVLIAVWRRRARKVAPAPPPSSLGGTRQEDEEIDTIVEQEVKKFRGL